MLFVVAKFCEEKLQLLINVDGISCVKSLKCKKSFLTNKAGSLLFNTLIYAF